MSRMMRLAPRIVALLLAAVAAAGCAAATPTMTPVQTATRSPATWTPTVTTAPTLTATPIPPPTVTPTPLATATPAPLPTATPTPAPPPAAIPTRPPRGALQPEIEPGIYAVVGVALDDELNARAAPGADQVIVGTLPPYATGVQVTGSGRQAGDAVWAPIAYQGLGGWANGAYLARQAGRAAEPVAMRAAAVIQAIALQDLETLSQYVHPDQGVRFSPYPFVDTGPEGDLVFPAEALPALEEDPTVYRWGIFDGSGAPIELTFSEYWQRFVYDADFWQPHWIGFNEAIGHGNVINNIPQAYPDGLMVEYHFQGFDPALEGLDWRSLRLVLEEQGGTWYLVGIIHAEWTI